MEFSEKKIEDLIVNNIKSGNIEALRKRGLYGVEKYDKFFRQFNLGKYGILDLVGVRYDPFMQSSGCLKSFNIGVIEIKKGEVNNKTFLQAIRYCKGIEVLLKHYKMTASFEICLIGTSISNDEFVYVNDFIDNLSVYTVQLDLEQGITFKSEHGYELTEYTKPLVSEITVADLKGYVKDKIKEYVTEPFQF